MIVTLLHIAALLLLSSAAPNPSPKADPQPIVIPLTRRWLGGVGGLNTLESMRNNVLKFDSKLARGLEAYERNTGHKHPQAPPNNNIGKRATGKVALTDDAEILWYGNVQVGTPPKTFVVDFDTGSADFFIPSKNCTINCTGHKSYDPSKSSTAKNTKKAWTATFGDGSSATGTIYNDTVNLGGLVATGAAVGAAKTYSSSLAISNFLPDGLLGMAFQTVSVFNRAPTFQKLLSQGKPSSAIFGFTLQPGRSELYLGAVNKARISGETTYLPVTTEAFWQVKLDGVVYGNKTVGAGGEAVIDTGTTLVIGELATVKKVYAAIPGSKLAIVQDGVSFFTVPCKAIPTISLKFGGRNFKITPNAFNFGALATGSSECVGGIVGQTALGGFKWIVGDVFLSGVYSTFDVGKKRVGFSNLK